MYLNPVFFPVDLFIPSSESVGLFILSWLVLNYLSGFQQLFQQFLSIKNETVPFFPQGLFQCVFFNLHHVLVTYSNQLNDDMPVTVCTCKHIVIMIDFVEFNPFIKNVQLVGSQNLSFPVFVT